MDKAHWTYDHDWPARTVNATINAGISREDAARMTDSEWLRVPFIGKIGLSSIRQDFPAPAVAESPHSAYARGWRDAMHAVSQAIGAVFIPPLRP